MILEALEPRIAPATIINVGAPTDSAANTTYSEAPFVLASQSTDPGIQGLFAGSNSNYVLLLSAGDKVRMFDPTQGYKDFLTVQAGKALFFFQDKNTLDNGRVEAGDLTGISVGAGAFLSVAGSVDGDIIANFNSKTGLLSPTALIPDATSIAALNIAGSVNGSVFAAGAIGNISIQGKVEQISTSSSGNYTYDFGGSVTGVGEETLAVFAPAAGKAGSAITGVSVGSVDKIIAGVGGAGANGGNISRILITSDSDGFDIVAGKGGAGTRGGSGGLVSNVTVQGTVDFTTNFGTIKISGGDGGAASAGAGGNGGAVSGIFVGYQLSGSRLVPSSTALNDYVEVLGGNGANGSASGGFGGSISNINIYTSAPEDPLKKEILVSGGVGGNATLPNGRGGAGGNATNIFAVNLNEADASTPGLRDDMLVSGGNAGGGGAIGAAGGNVQGINVFSDRVFISGGNGSSGTTSGGIGGGISRIVASFRPSDLINSISLIAGQGGFATSGAGGAGGSVSNVQAAMLDFKDTSNEVHAGDGGDSSAGAGGKGGDLSSIGIFEQTNNTPFNPAVLEPVISFKAGDGGDGGRSGGLGGAVSSLTLLGYNTLPRVFAGDGGASTVAGTGSNGGAVSNLRLKVWNIAAPLSGGVDVHAGKGGDG